MQNKLANVVIWLALVLAPLIGQTRIDLGRQGKSINFSGAGATKPFQTGTVLPSTCTAGDTFFKADASPNKSLYTCSQNGTWNPVGDDGVPAAVSGTNGVLSTNGSTIEWRALGGDISGPPQAVQVQGIQGRLVAPDAPGSGQILSWNSTGNRWEPATPVQSSAANYKITFSGESALTITGAVHGMNSANLISSCYLGSTQLLAVSGYRFSVDPASYDVTITFPTAFTGVCVLNASSGGTGGGGSYTLPAATASERGGVKVGAGLSISGDVLSATGGGGGGLGTLTGVIKASSGVPSVVAGNPTDCVFANGTSGSCAAGSTVTAGSGIRVTGSAVSVDPGAVPSFLVASATLDFAAIAAGKCSILTYSFPGASPGDSVVGGWPADMSTGITTRILISATNTVQIQLCNVTTGTIDPPSRTYGATIVRSF